MAQGSGKSPSDAIVLGSAWSAFLLIKQCSSAMRWKGREADWQGGLPKLSVFGLCHGVVSSAGLSSSKERDLSTPLWKDISLV